MRWRIDLQAICDSGLLDIVTTAGANGFTPSAAGTNTSVTAGTSLTVFVGATVSPVAAQAAGNYSGTVTMSAVYF